ISCVHLHMPMLGRSQRASLRRESLRPTRPRPNSASVAGSGTLLEITLVQCAASLHWLPCGHPRLTPGPIGWSFTHMLGGPATKKTSANRLDDPVKMRQLPFAGALQSTFFTPKLRPVTDSMFKSSARAKAASKDALTVLKVESNDDLLKVTS